MYDERRGNLNMKNKILASLLAVCLFVGMAVPAFAAYSSVEGDATKITSIEFTKKELTLANGEEKNLSELVKAYESKEKMVLDLSTIEYSLEGNSLAFGITGSTVVAVDNSGTSTAVAKTADGKVIAKLPLKATPVTADRYATGFRFASSINNIAVGANAEDVSFKVSPMPAGAVLTDINRGVIDTAVKAAVAKAMRHYKTADQIDSEDANLAIVGLPVDWTVNFEAKDATATTDENKVIVTKDDTTKKLSIVLTSGFTTIAAVETININVANAELAKVMSGVKFVKTTGDKTVLKVKTGNVVAKDGTAVDPVVGYAMDGKDMKYTVTAPAGLLPSIRKAIEATASITDKDGINPREIKAAASFQNIAATKAIAVGGPGTITIEVGETYKAGEKLAYAPSAANVGKAVTWSLDYLNDKATSYDYAIVDGGDITGVAVGSNKVIATLNGDTSKAATIIVNVVAKGTLPKPTDKKPTTPLHVNMIVGNTHKIAIKDVPANVVPVFAGLNDKVATVTADGTIKAVAAGNAVVKVTVGTEVIYVNVIVKAAPAVVDPTKPTDVPKTGVSFFSF